MESNTVPKKGNPLVKKHGLSKSDAIKRSIKYHLAGLNGKGLIFKSLERLSELVGNEDASISLQAIDKVVKILPYAITREENPGLLSVQGNGSPVNIQINFDQQIRERLQGTHLQGLISNVVPDSASLGSQDEASEAQFTPPPAPGDGGVDEKG